MQSLTPEVRQQLLKFPVGTIVESQSGEYIGHVVGYHMHERNYNDWGTRGRWIYQLKIKWASTIETEYIHGKDSCVDFRDVKILEEV